MLIWRDKRKVFELGERSRLTLWRLSGPAPTQTQVQPQKAKMMNPRITRIVFSLLIFVNTSNGGMYRRRYRARQRNQRSFSKNSSLPQPIAISGVIRGHKCKFKFYSKYYIICIIPRSKFRETIEPIYQRHFPFNQYIL